MSNQRRTLFVHFGWHKTGTTSIQALVRQNRDLLERTRHLYYPRAGQGGDAHHVLACSVLDSDPPDDSLLNQLKRELDLDTEWETALVSSEMLNAATDQQVEMIASALSGDWELRAVCYLRLPDEYLEALFGERVKSGQFQDDWNEFITGIERKNSPNYLEVVRRWKGALGEDAVIVRPYERASFLRGDLYADFFDAIGLPGTESDPGITIPPRANVSPDAATLSVIRETARNLRTTAVNYSGYFLKTHLCEAIQSNLPASDVPRPPARFFSTEKRKACRARYQATFDELGIHFATADRYPDEPKQPGLLEYHEMDPALREGTLMAGVVAMTSELASIHCKGVEGQPITHQRQKPLPSPKPKPSPAQRDIDPEFRPTLYVHIGHSKTGSTTIQQALRDNIDALRNRGLLVADRNLDFPEEGTPVGHPLEFFERLQKAAPERARAEISSRLDALRHRLAAGRYRGAVISSENLSQSASLFVNVTDKFDLHAIYYVRRQDAWIESAWKQWGIKEGLDIGEYAKVATGSGRPDFLTAARDWKGVTTRIHVAPLDGIPDLVGDFWSVLGLADSPPPAASRSNTTFDWSILDLLSKNAHLFSDVSDNGVFETLENLLPEGATQDGSKLLPPQTCDEIIGHHQVDNDTLKEEFFPQLKALHDYPKRGRVDTDRADWDSIASIQRYLGFQLLMLGTIDQRLGSLATWHAQGNDAGEITPDQAGRKIVKLKAETTSLNSDNKELRKEIRFLSRKVEEIEEKMARSLIWRLKKLLGIGRK